MIILNATTKSIELVLGGTPGAEAQFMASYVDVTTTTYSPSENDGVTTGTTPVTAVAAPAASTQRQVKLLTVANIDSAAIVLTVQYNNSGTTRRLWRGTLMANESLVYTDGDGFQVHGIEGVPKSQTVTTASGEVPIGGIIAWSGLISAIPDPFAFCNGTDNAPGPDLRDRFIVGAYQDDAGLAKTNIRGSLEQSATATGHDHSLHGNLFHTGGSVGDHTGLTHAVAIADHPSLTHPALSHPAQTLTHADHSVASQIVSVAGLTHGDHSIASRSVDVAGLTHADHSVASFTGSCPSVTGTVASGTHSHASIAGVASFASGTNRSGRVSQPTATGTVASKTFSVASVTHTHAAITLTHASHPTHTGSLAAWTEAHASHPTHTGSSPALTLAHGDHSIASLSHQDIGSHAAAVHSITQPADHGAAGTLMHSFTQPDAHSISAHDTMSMVPSFYALAWIQRMS